MSRQRLRAPVLDTQRQPQIQPPRALQLELADLAWTLNPLWQTIRRWLEAPYYEPTSPWGKDSLARVPQLLRRVLRVLPKSG